MIRGLRKAHLPLTVVIAALTLGVAALALRTRPSPAATRPLPTKPPLEDSFDLVLRSRDEQRPRVLFDGRTRVEVVQEPLLTAPGILLLCGEREFEDNWTDTGRVVPLEEITDLSSVAALTSQRRQSFELPPACRTSGSELFFYSTGHQEVFARAALTRNAPRNEP